MNWTAGALIVALAATIVIGVSVNAQSSGATTNVEVRVWQRVSEAQALFISARPRGGSWRTLGTIPLGVGEASAYRTTSSGRFRYSDITLAGVDVRVWQSERDAHGLYISARPTGGSWRALGTIPLGEGKATAYQTSGSGRYRYSDIALDVPAPASARPPRPTATHTPLSAVCRWGDSTERVVASTVKVSTPSSTGSAFYVGNQQWITAGHVVDGSTRLVTLTNARIRTTATVVGVYGKNTGDVAILRAPAGGAQPLGWAGRLPQGTPVGVVGYPRGHDGDATFARGIVSRYEVYGGFHHLQTDAAANPGNSGGPVVDACGRVAGVLVSGWEDSEGLNYAVADPSLSRLLRALGLTGYVVTPPGEYPEETWTAPTQRPAPSPTPRPTPTPAPTPTPTPEPVQPATPDMVADYVHCVHDYWKDTLDKIDEAVKWSWSRREAVDLARRMVIRLETGKGAVVAHGGVRFGVLWACHEHAPRERLMMLPVVKHWNADVTAFWRAYERRWPRTPMAESVRDTGIARETRRIAHTRRVPACFRNT